jgi:hypothetical protein
MEMDKLRMSSKPIIVTLIDETTILGDYIQTIVMPPSHMTLAKTKSWFNKPAFTPLTVFSAEST